MFSKYTNTIKYYKFFFISIIFIIVNILLLCFFFFDSKTFFIKKAIATIYKNSGLDTDTCGKIFVTATESPICNRLTIDDLKHYSCPVNNPGDTNNISSYSLRLSIRSNDGEKHTISYFGATNFCNSGFLENNEGFCTCIDHEEHTAITDLVIPANGSRTITLSRSSLDGSACGSYQFDFGVLSVDGDTSCTIRNDVANNFSGISSGCETGIDCSGAKTYNISGNIFIDDNKNGEKDFDEENYLDVPNIVTNLGNISNSPFGTYLISNVSEGDVTLSYPSLPEGYTIVYPKNGPPPSFSVTVGNSCDTKTSADATCNNGDINNLNFAITNSIPWMQSYGMDLRFDNGYTNMLPQNNYALVNDSSSTTPGIVFSGDTKPDIGIGELSTTNWTVGNTIYPEIYTTGTLSTSYQSLKSKATQTGKPILEITEAVPSCKNIENCTLPASLKSGIYHINGDVSLKKYNFPANSNFLFLVNGTLTITGDQNVPQNSIAIFSAKDDIIIDSSVENPTNTLPVSETQIEGIYSADRDIIIQGNNDCTDHMLNVAGSFIVNADKQNGLLKNERDLCDDNTTIPSFTITPRLDFLFSAPSILTNQKMIFREELP